MGRYSRGGGDTVGRGEIGLSVGGADTANGVITGIQPRSHRRFISHEHTNTHAPGTGPWVKRALCGLTVPCAPK